MRTSRLVMVAVATAAAIALAFAQPAGAQYEPSVLSVSPTNPAPGGAVTVSGDGCAPGAAVTVTVASGGSSSTTAGATGGFSTSVTAPTTAGTYTVTATCGVLVLSGTIHVGATTGGTGALPVTGSDTKPLALGAVGLVTAGGLLVLATRKRRTVES